MQSPIPALDAGKTVADACLFIGERNIRYLAVTRNDKIAGIVTIRDFLPPQIYQSALTTDDLLNKVEDYGRELLERAE
jgi:signal-transduction protein with cAMP-binding, CBS, and nucleotidyltransferase domain